jgi:hypothetical protein
MEYLYRPRIIRFSQVHTVIDELDGIDSYQIKVSEDTRLVKAGTYTVREHQRSYRNYLTGSSSHLRPPTCDRRIQAHKGDNARSDSSW